MLIDFYNTGILTWKRTNYIQQIKHLHGLENRGGKLRAWLIPVCCSIEELRGYTPHVGGFHLAACLSRNACAGWHEFRGLGNFRARKETSVRNMEGRNTKTCIQGHKRLVAWWEPQQKFLYSALQWHSDFVTGHSVSLSPVVGICQLRLWACHSFLIP